MVGLVKDHEIVIRQQLGIRLAAAPDGQIAEKQGMVDQQQGRFLRLAAHPVIKAAVKEAALLAFAGIGIRPNVGPAGIGEI